MHELKLIAAMSAAVLAVAGMMSAARPAAEQTITAEELAELTAIRPVPGKNGLYVIPGYDGGVTGGNVAVRVTNDGVIIVDNKFPHSFRLITSEVRKVTSLPIKYVLDGCGSSAQTVFRPFCGRFSAVESRPARFSGRQRQATPPTRLFG